MKITCIWQGPAQLGECPVWHTEEQALYWIDITAPALHRFDPATKAQQSWTMPERIGAIAPRAQGGLIAAIGDSFAAIDLPSGAVHKLIDVPSLSDARLNDGKCDRQGRFWVGSVSKDLKNLVGTLYCFAPDGALREMEYGLGISNGLGWSPDNRLMYHTDRHIIYQYSFDVATGNLKHRRVFAQLPVGNVVHDGLTVDAEGYVWSALWNGWKIVRYAPDGRVEREIEMPVQRPTSCIFGGPKLDTLYVTSCSRDVNESVSLPEPLAGGVFAIKLDVTGLPETAFLG